MEFTELFKPELGCLNDFKLEVKFKKDAKPIFCKPRPVPYAIQENLAQAYDAGIAKGVWYIYQDSRSENCECVETIPSLSTNS